MHEEVQALRDRVGEVDQLRERILREIDAFTGSALQQDDMTMVLLRVEPVGHPVGTQTLAHADA